MPIPKLFVDANVFFSAIKSSRGGSAEVFKLAEYKIIKIAVSSLVLFEARRNIAKKLPSTKIFDFFNLINDIGFEITNVDKKKSISKYGQIIASKDASVLAAAIESKSDFLITLDRKHFMSPKIKKVKLPIKILIPGDFLQKYL